jgi:hypothetical protein
MRNDNKIVWILGAGFSQPLGAPLLGQLLSAGSFRDLAARYGDNPRIISDAAKAVCHLYHYGRAYEGGRLTESTPSGEALWGDAEVFIDLLDSAVADSGARITVERIIKTIRKTTPSLPDGGWSVKELREAARHLIAAECSTFALGASPAQERWSAHVDWAGPLDGRHTLITFNYDRVLERVAGQLRLTTKRPIGPALLLPSELTKSLPGQPRGLKLHGSVDWQMTENQGIVRAADEAFALSAPDDQLVIATPGPTKSKITEALEPLWSTAEDAIGHADAIVFVGYRFPPTDATARRRILRAIERRARTGRSMALHVVLGPNSLDAPRLAELLRFAAERGGQDVQVSTGRLGKTMENTCHLRVHQLYSQDFFTVYSEDLLGLQD